MVTEIPTQIFSIAALIVSAISLSFTARTYSKSRINDQVNMAHEIITSVKKNMDELNSFKANFPKDKEGNLTYDSDELMVKHDSLSASILNDLDWLCYLIEGGIITDPKVIDYFDTIRLEFYDENFLIFKDRFKRKYSGKLFPDFQKRYKKIKDKWNGSKTEMSKV